MKVFQWSMQRVGEVELVGKTPSLELDEESQHTLLLAVIATALVGLGGRHSDLVSDKTMDLFKAWRHVCRRRFPQEDGQVELFPAKIVQTAPAVCRWH